MPASDNTAGPYRPIVRAGNLLFVSGQIGLDKNAVLRDGFIGQFRQAMSNLESVLASEEVTLRDVVKTTVFLIDPTYFDEMNSLYQSYFSVQPPSRSCVTVSALPKDALVEIEAVACLPQSNLSV